MVQSTTSTSTMNNNTMNANTVIFASIGDQVLSSMVHLLGCSVLSACLVRRLAWQNLTLSKLCVMAILADSWFFLFTSGLIVSGIGLSFNTNTCMTGIYLCIFFYASSKFLIYLFLTERVHIVWHANKPTSRLRSRVWIICFIALLGYIAIFVLMLIGRIGFIRQDRVCVIGLKHMASIPLLSYDVFVNIALTGLFVYPLLRKWVSNLKLVSLAKYTCVAAAIALATSVVNMLILTIFNGQQLGWVCLASCGFDVTVNAIAIYVISRKLDTSSNTTSKGREPIKIEPSFSHRLSNRQSTGHGLGVINPLNVLPTLRNKRSTKTSPFGTHSDGWPHTFSRIGDFATTRDDGGGTGEARAGSLQRDRDRSHEWGRHSRQYRRTGSNAHATIAEGGRSSKEGHRSFLPLSKRSRESKESGETRETRETGETGETRETRETMETKETIGSMDEHPTKVIIAEPPTMNFQDRNGIGTRINGDGFDSQGLQSTYSTPGTGGEVPSFRATPISWPEDEKEKEGTGNEAENEVNAEAEAEADIGVESFILSMSDAVSTPRYRVMAMRDNGTRISTHQNDNTFGIASRTTRPLLDVHMRTGLQ